MTHGKSTGWTLPLLCIRETHENPQNLQGLRDLFGAQACHGECLAVDQYSFTMFKDGKS